SRAHSRAAKRCTTARFSSLRSLTSFANPPEKLGMPSQNHFHDCIREALDKRYAAGEQVVLCLEVCNHVGQDADVLNQRSGGKARSRDVPDSDSETVNDSGMTLRVWRRAEGVVFD